MDTVFNIIQSAVFIAWVVITILLARRVNRLDRRIGLRVDPLEPICGCTHHLCFHDESGCGHTKDYYERIISCGCKHYSGPEQLPQVIP